MSNGASIRFVLTKARRHLLLVVAPGGLLSTTVAIFLFKDHPSVHGYGFALAGGLTFVWTNGLYWLVLREHPYIEVQHGVLARREEISGSKPSQFNKRFFVMYFGVAALITIGYRAKFLNA